MPAQRSGAASADVSSSGTEEMPRASAIITSAYPPSVVTPDTTGFSQFTMLRAGRVRTPRLLRRLGRHQPFDRSSIWTLRYPEPQCGQPLRVQEHAAESNRDRLPSQSPHRCGKCHMLPPESEPGPARVQELFVQQCGDYPAPTLRPPYMCLSVEAPFTFCISTNAPTRTW